MVLLENLVVMKIIFKGLRISNKYVMKTTINHYLIKNVKNLKISRKRLLF